MIRFRCPQCDQKMRAPPEHAGRSTRCPQCDRGLIIPDEFDREIAASGDLIAEELPPPAAAGRIGFDHLLALVSFAWIWWGMLRSSILDNIAALITTLILLGLGLLVSIYVLFRFKRVPVLLCLTQIILFGIVHVQVYATLGPHHYTCDHPPKAVDWLRFTAVHVIRAADVLDVIEEYGINLQTVRHASMQSAILLVLLHLTVSVFFLGVLVRAVLRIWRWVHPR